MKTTTTTIQVLALAMLCSLATVGFAQPTLTLADMDNDGFEAVQLGGTDCDDLNPAVYPGAPGSFENLDNNCNCMIDLDEEWPIAPDVNHNSFVDAADLLLILERFGSLAAEEEDINRDGQVDARDVEDVQFYYMSVCRGW